nr:type IV pilus modification protein PilV [uncultured Halomonas sp.]
MRQVGVSLIESLVALLLISIALLGVAALQLTSLQDARDTRWRVDAVSLANGMLELIRADSDQAKEFATVLAASPPATCSGDTVEICRSAQEWQADVTKTLPNALASVAVTTVDDIDRVTISLRWRQQPPTDDNPLPGCGSDALSGGCVVLETHL